MTSLPKFCGVWMGGQVSRWVVRWVLWWLGVWVSAYAGQGKFVFESVCTFMYMHMCRKGVLAYLYLSVYMCAFRWVRGVCMCDFVHVFVSAHAHAHTHTHTHTHTHIHTHIHTHTHTHTHTHSHHTYRCSSCASTNSKTTKQRLKSAKMCSSQWFLMSCLTS